MKRTHICAAAIVCLLGAFSIKAYVDLQSPVADQYGILTPISEDPEEGSLIIPDGIVPLSGGPGVAEPGISGQDSSSGASVYQVDPYAQEIMDLVNAERAKAGLAPLALVSEISQAAELRASDLYSKFSHERPDGSSYKTALHQYGISYRGTGENVAYGYRTPKAVMEGWMNSEGHRNNILNEKFTNIGVGHYKGSNGYDYWVQMFT